LAAYGTPNYITGTNAMKNDNLTKIAESAKVSSFWIENGSFARLDNMTLGYTFDTKKIDWLSKARLYVTAQNLFVITGYKGLDPEVNYSSTSGLSPGIEAREYFPKSRSFIFGVNLTF
jgi:iron complex outermembrane receptor protein